MLNWFKQLFNNKSQDINVRFELRDGSYYEELVNADNFDERYNEIQKKLNPKKRRKDITFIWCLVGNIVEEQLWGEDKEIRRRTKHFSANTKVYCFPPLWGDGYEKVKVIGLHKKSKRLITMIIPSRHITNWRIQQVFKPYIVDEMYSQKGWTDSESDKERIVTLRDSLLDWEKKNTTDNTRL